MLLASLPKFVAKFTKFSFAAYGLPLVRPQQVLVLRGVTDLGAFPIAAASLAPHGQPTST